MKSYSRLAGLNYIFLSPAAYIFNYLKKNYKLKKVGLVRFELTIDGYLRTTALTVLVLVSIYQCSNGSSSSCPVGKDSVDPLFIIYPLEPIAMPG